MDKIANRAKDSLVFTYHFESSSTDYCGEFIMRINSIEIN